MSANFLERIVAARRRQVALDKAAAGETFGAEAQSGRTGKRSHRLRQALDGNHDLNIIAEFKRASPSLGWIQRHANPGEMAMLYEMGGACAVSVLTEPDFFRGSLEDVRAVRLATGLPILRKDFIVDQFQIEEAAQAEADAVLLIVSALSDEELSNLRAFAEEELGLDALVEVHTENEMERAKNCGAKLIGVNNRDLQTLTTSLETSERLSEHAPAGATLVSESGLSSPKDVARLKDCGYRGFLIGESLMRSSDPDDLIRSFRGIGSEVRNV